MKTLIFALIIALVISGCQSLPPGNAPDGAIVNPFKAESALNESAAVNYMVTSISMRCAPIANSGGQGPWVGMRFNNSDDPLAKILPEKLFRELLKISLIKYETAKVPEYYIVSNLAKETDFETKTEIKIWDLKFVSTDGRTEFWHEKVTLKKEISK